jgi:ribosome recycling factor
MAIENEQFEMIMMETIERTDKTISVLQSDYVTIRAGRANPHILDKIQVEAYGAMSPINQIGNISVVDAQCLMISPWDKSLLKSVEKAIQLSNLGINPTNDGNVIRLVFPMLTEERRKELVKDIRKTGENAKVAVRNIRRDAVDAIKNLKKQNEITEDDQKGAEKDIQDLTDKNVKFIDNMIADKEKELMAI